MRHDCFILFCSLLLLGSVEAAEKPQPPNIVLIMADDMGFSDIGCYGGEIRTPNLNRLAYEGMRFSQFYNNAKCTTTRASLMTGLYPRPKGGLLKPEMVTIPEVLKSAGYRSVLSGKWHLGSAAPNRPSDRGFDHYYGLLDGCCNFHNPALPDPAFKGGKVRWFGKDDQRITEFPAGYYTTDAFSDYAAATIKTAAADGAPFFLHVCYTAPHYPLHAKPDTIASYRNQYKMGWEQLRQTRYQRQLKMGLIDPRWTLPGPDPEVKPWESNPHQDYQDHLMATYAAMIETMDQGIGKLIDAVDTAGLAEETIIMFLSDNGGCAELPGGVDPSRTPGVAEFYTTCGPGWAYAQNTPFRRFKQWVHEGGISTPLIVRWPGTVPAKAWCREVGHIIDILPTCAEIAGVEIPVQRQGIPVLPTEGLSLLPLFEGESRTGHETLYWEWSGNRAVRQGDLKLCWDQKVKAWELYDLVNDRTETNNLAAKAPEKVQELSQLWFNWAERTGVKAK